MSYEGYTQGLCQSGHHQTKDSYESWEPCFWCKSKITWENEVDQTNCDDVGYIDLDKHFLSVAAEFETCNLGHEHQVKQAVYRIPSEEEQKKYQTRCDEDGELVYLFKDETMEGKV